MDTPSWEFPVNGSKEVDADPPIDERPPTLVAIREAMAKLRSGKSPGICNISAELLRAGGEAMISGLQAVLTVVWHSDTIFSHTVRGCWSFLS